MGDIALKVDKLSKTFERPGKSGRESFFALKDVSFELYKGEILGVIGSNGSGKSTLLKILSSIYPPDSGNAEYSGRMASIIEIGTGFHAELTGRENIYLGGRLMGLTNKEIDSVYNEIVDFSGIEEFIDSPVKHYSSGMYLRLAFSVAFAGNVDVLLLDEVIAVGDEDFKYKCYKKLDELLSKNVGVILVSHSMQQILEHCKRTIWMDKGELKAQGESQNIVNQYVNAVDSNISGVDKLPISNDFLEIYKIWSNSSDNVFSRKEIIKHTFHLNKKTQDTGLQIAVKIQNVSGISVLMDTHVINYGQIHAPGQYHVSFELPPYLLSKGYYKISIVVGIDGELHKTYNNLISFTIQGGEKFDDYMKAVVTPRLSWKIEAKTN